MSDHLPAARRLCLALLASGSGVALACQVLPPSTTKDRDPAGDRNRYATAWGGASIAANETQLFVLHGDRLLFLDSRTLNRVGEASLAQTAVDLPQSRASGEASVFPGSTRVSGKGTVRFSHSPMRTEDIGSIIPMGLMVSAHVTPIDHIYFAPRDRDSGRFAYDVMAPADGVITSIQHRTQLQGSTETRRDYDDYRVVLQHTGSFASTFDLITRLAPSIEAKAGGAFQGGPTRAVSIPVRAGEVIGKVGGRTLDFAVTDTEKRLPGLLVPEHYSREPWKIHTVDPFDYFDEPLKSRLLALNPRKAAPRGGKIDYDQPGKAVGNWFRQGTHGYAGSGDPRGYWTGHLALAYHHIDPSIVIVSIGDFGGMPRQFAVKGNQPDPAKVTAASGPVKYELVFSALGTSGQRYEGLDPSVKGVLMVEVLPANRMRVEVFPGRTATQVEGFSDSGQNFER